MPEPFTALEFGKGCGGEKADCGNRPQFLKLPECVREVRKQRKIFIPTGGLCDSGEALVVFDFSRGEELLWKRHLSVTGNYMIFMHDESDSVTYDRRHHITVSVLRIGHTAK